MRWLRLLLSLTFLVLTTCVEASVGVSPALYDARYQPGFDERYVFMFSSDEPNTVFDIYAEGDLSQFVSLSTKQLDGSGSVEARLRLAEKPSPGNHRLYIGGRQRARDVEGVVLVGNIRGVIDLRVPYPGQYAEIALQIPDANVGEEVPLTLIVHNRGEEAITARGTIEIFNSNNEPVTSFELGSIGVKQFESGNLVAKLSTKELSRGDYKAAGVVLYGEKRADTSYTFRLGELRVALVNYSSVFSGKDLVPFSLVVESLWNNDIADLSAHVSIIGSDVTFQTLSVALPAWQRVTLIGYLPLNKIQERNVDALIRLLYEGTEQEERVSLYIEKGTPWMIIILISIGILAVISLFILWRIHGKTKTRKR